MYECSFVVPDGVVLWLLSSACLIFVPIVMSFQGLLVRDFAGKPVEGADKSALDLRPYSRNVST